MTKERAMTLRDRLTLLVCLGVMAALAVCTADLSAQECTARVEATDSVRVEVACPLPAPDTVIQTDTVTVVDTVLQVDTVFVEDTAATEEPEPTEPPAMPQDISVDVVEEGPDTLGVHADWSDVDGATWYRLRQGFNDGTPASEDVTGSVSEATINVPRQSGNETAWLCARAGNSVGLGQPRCTSLRVPAAVSDTAPSDTTSDTDPEPTPDEGALLTGMTPSNVTVPEGWKLHTTEDFEEPNELSGRIIGYGTDGVVQSRANNGKNAMSVLVDGDAKSTALEVSSVQSREIYMSWYEYIDSDASFNDETYFAEIKKDLPDGGFVSFIFDMFVAGSEMGFNSEEGFWLVNVQEAGFQIEDQHAAWDVVTRRVRPVGRWVQYEWHLKTNDPGVRNGLSRFYVDGELVHEVTDANFNGNIDMSGMDVEFRYLYTRHNWYEDYPGSSLSKERGTENKVCSSFIGDGAAIAESDGTQSHRQWSFGEGKGVCDPPEDSGRTGDIQPTAPVHRFWMDDIILLIR